MTGAAPRRRLSLWTQLFLAAMASTAVALGVVGLFVQHATASQLTAYNHRRSLALVHRVGAALADQYRRQGESGLQAAATHYATLLSSVITIETGSGHVLYQSRPITGVHRGGSTVAATVPLYPLGPRVRVVLSHLPTLGPRLSPVIRSLLSSLLVALLVGFLASLLLSSLVGDRIVRQLQRIAHGARRLGAGEWSYRVAPEGPTEVRALAEDFNRMAGALESGEEDRQRLMADVAHELRTPLAILEGYLEAWREGVDIPGADPLAVAQQQARIVSQLVDELQDMALADAHQLDLQRSEVDVARLAVDVGTEWRRSADQRHIHLTVDHVPVPSVWGDPRRLRQVLGNLVGNAVKYTPDGGRVAVRVQPDPATRGVRLTVADNGPGIAPEHQAHVFDRLYRVDSSRSRGTGGFGLGLAIAKELVELHGGQIGVESTPGHGATFFVVLPQAPLGQPPSASPGEAPQRKS